MLVISWVTSLFSCIIVISSPQRNGDHPLGVGYLRMGCSGMVLVLGGFQEKRQMGILLFCGYPRIFFSLGQWCIWPTPLLVVSTTKMLQSDPQLGSKSDILLGGGRHLSGVPYSHFYIHHLHFKAILYHT